MWTWIAAIVLILFALWMIGVCLFAMAQPRTAIRLIGKFASTTLINFTELGLRLIVGIAFIIVAPGTSWPLAFKVIGWLLAVSAVALMLIPRRWHAGYAVFWSQRLPVWTVYPTTLAAMVASVMLIISVWPLVAIRL